MNSIELRLAARVLGTSVAQIRSLCALIGARPYSDNDEQLIERVAFDRIYAILHERYTPPDGPASIAA